MKRTFLLATWALMATPVLAGAIDIQWSEAGGFQQELSVNAGKVLEVCGKLPAQVSIDWWFESSAAMASNIHYHAGKKVIFPAKHPAASVLRDRLTTTVEQDYCWMWTNAGPQAIAIKFGMEKIK